MNPTQSPDVLRQVLKGAGRIRISLETGSTRSGGARRSPFKNKPVCSLILRNRNESRVRTLLPQEPSPPPTAKISIYRAAPRRPGEAPASCAPRWSPPGQRVRGGGVRRRRCGVLQTEVVLRGGGGVPRRSGFPRRWVSCGVGETHGRGVRGGGGVTAEVGGPGGGGTGVQSRPSARRPRSRSAGQAPLAARQAAPSPAHRDIGEDWGHAPLCALIQNRSPVQMPRLLTLLFHRPRLSCAVSPCPNP